MSLALKCFSQVNTLSFSNLFLKSWSISLVLVISLSHSFLHFLCASSFCEGSFHNPIPFVLLHDPQPNTAHLSPGITLYKHFSCNSCDQRLISTEKYPNSEQILTKLPLQITLDAILYLCVCTVMSTWLSEKHNKEIVLWSSPAFITSHLY